jgi:DNA-binding NarL/FixJ family response regulator
VVLDRLSLVARLRDELPTVRLLALGAAVDQGLVRECIRAGVDGCGNMNTSPSAVGEMIRRIYDGEPVYETRALLELLQTPQPPSVTTPRLTASLAKRELEVLSATAMGLNTAEAADFLGISVNTLRTHLKNILAKLEARSKLEAVLIAIREGRVDLPENHPRA